MKITQITPMPGKILVKKLPDETTTKSGILLPKDGPINNRHEYVEVVAVGENISEDMGLKIEVDVGNTCIILGRGIYDAVPTDDEICYIIDPVDIVAIIE